jgi:hypothetical protein
MARQTYYVTREQRHPLYRTRMLTAGQSLELDAGAAALFGKLGVELATEKPRKAAPIPTTEEVLTAGVVEAPKPTPRKAAPRKRTARKSRAKK